MSDDETVRLALPLLHAGQAQKEVDHNEALARLDLAVHASVVEAGRNDPPAAPAEGACWIVGASPVGAWAGHAHALAGWTQGGWRFVAACAGMTVWRSGDGLTLRHDGAGWIAGELHASRVLIAGEAVIGPRGNAIADPVGGTAPDGEARAAIAAILAALRGHGLIAA